MTPTEAADAAAEAIRSLNHSPMRGAGYVYPSDVDAVVACLEALTQRLPQALLQAEQWINARAEEGKVGDDRADVDPVATVETASVYLTAARVEAGRLAQSLTRARNATAHLTGIVR